MGTNRGTADISQGDIKKQMIGGLKTSPAKSRAEVLSLAMVTIGGRRSQESLRRIKIPIRVTTVVPSGSPSRLMMIGQRRNLEEVGKTSLETTKAAATGGRNLNVRRCIQLFVLVTCINVPFFAS